MLVLPARADAAASRGAGRHKCMPNEQMPGKGANFRLNRPMRSLQRCQTAASGFRKARCELQVDYLLPDESKDKHDPQETCGDAHIASTAIHIFYQLLTAILIN